MQVEEFVAARGDAVHIDAHQERRRIGAEDGSGLLDHFAASRIADERIFGFHVSAGKQPSLQTAVQHQQDAVPIGAKHQAGAGDVAGIELAAGERIGRARQQRQCELFAFGGFAVGGGVELLEQRNYSGEFDHASIMARLHSLTGFILKKGLCARRLH